MPDGLRNWSTLLARALLFFLYCAAGPAGLASIETVEEDVVRRIQSQLGSDRSFALVIGISQFDHWNALGGVGEEIDDVKRALTHHGFKVIDGVPQQEGTQKGRVTSQELHNAISEFFRSYGKDPANRLVVYIATHGAREILPGRDGVGLLIASDSESANSKTLASSAYSVKQLSLDIEGVNAQHIYFFFNACFSGAMVPEMRGEDEPVLPGIDAAPLSPAVADWTITLLAHNARLVLTAGNDDQLVPDRHNPFARAFADGLAGEADGDHDGLILGTELAQYMRGRVARETREMGSANDPVFAILPKTKPPAVLRDDVPAVIADNVNYALHGDFIFLSPRGPGGTALAASEDAVLSERLSRMEPGQFVDCSDCPVMVEIPAQEKNIALARTETTFTEWDACFHDLACRRYINDDGFGRGDRPVGGATWLDQRDFVAWLNRRNKRKNSPCSEYRLPTSAEWTFAALAESKTRYPWGDDMVPARAVCLGCDEGLSGTAALRTASFPANRFGLYDMTGNMWEWVDDNDCSDGEFSRDGGCKTDGTVMGGAYSTSVNDISALSEGKLPRTGNDLSTMYSLPTVGFRVACTLRNR